MARLEEITPNTVVNGILPGALVTVVRAKWMGTVAVEVVYKDPFGRPDHVLLYRDREPTLEVGQAGKIPASKSGAGK